jgi:hypothetical protein
MNDIYQETKQRMSNAGEAVSRTTNNAANYIQQSTNGVIQDRDVDVGSYTNSTREFLESNSIIARFSFLIMAIFIFVILLRLMIYILSYFVLGKSGTVYLINGMVDGNKPIIFPQDPNRNSKAKSIIKSNNAKSGVEFTWSCWLYVNGMTTNKNDATIYKHVFSKGNNNWNTGTPNPNGVAYPNNAPGVYLSPTTNDLHIFMNTYNVISEDIIVNSIPLNKWFNLTICCVNKSLDIYINGIVVNSHQLSSVPKQNYGDVFVCNNGGFDGNLSNLVYYNRAISIQTIQNIMSAGPNFKAASDSKTDQKDYNYLSIDWYFNNPYE